MQIKSSSNKKMEPRWLWLIFKIIGLVYFIIALLLIVDEIIPEVIAQWPIHYPLIDLGLYSYTGYAIVSIIFGLGFFTMAKWLMPLLGSSFFAAASLAARGFGEDYFTLTALYLVLSIAAFYSRHFLKGSYGGILSIAVYTIFFAGIAMIYSSALHPVY